MIGQEMLFAVSGLLVFALPLVFYVLRDEGSENAVVDPVAEEMKAREHRNREKDD